MNFFGGTPNEVFNLIFDSVQKKINFDSTSSKFFILMIPMGWKLRLFEFINEFSNLSAEIGVYEYKRIFIN